MLLSLLIPLTAVAQEAYAVNATGIESIAADTEAQDGAGEYYDLSGRRVATARHGAYILRKGGKTRKIYIK